MPVATARDAADLLAPNFAGLKAEVLVVLHLDAEGQILAADRHASSDHFVELPFREIFRSAVEREASGLLVAHNHPSGDPRPSQADIAATRRLAEVAGALGLRLHDHLIFAGAECRSFRALGLL